MTAAQHQVQLGQDITYTITVTNLGPDEAGFGEIIDHIPDGTALVSFAVPAGWTAYTSQVAYTGYVYAVGERLAAGASASFTLVVRAVDYPPNPRTLEYINRAYFAPTTADPNHENNATAGSVVLQFPRADLGVTITASPGTVRLGQDLTYTVIVTNHGPSDAPVASLAVTLPAGAALRSAMTDRFLSQLYADLLGRPIDGPTLEGYTKALAAGPKTHQKIAESVLATSEYRRSLVRDLYQRFLRRTIGAADMASVDGLISSGFSERDIIVAVVCSQEYFLKAGGTNRGFLAQLYPDLLGRPIDPEGAKFWAQVLAAGPSRLQVVRAIMDSQEYARNMVQGLVQRFLRRPFNGSDGGYVQLARIGLTNEQVLSVILGGDEYVRVVAKEPNFTVENGTVTGKLVALPSGGSVTVTIVVTPGAAGAQVASARVSGPVEDPNRANNASQVSAVARVKATPRQVRRSIIIDRNKFKDFAQTLRGRARGNDALMHAQVERVIRGALEALRRHWRQETRNHFLSDPFEFPTL